MCGTASDLARRLARNAEGVCRHYLSNGHRAGRYWLVGDVDNSPGRSLYVRLTGADSGQGAAGKWTDAATGEHGDLLDLIALHCNHGTLGETLDEARVFLSLPRPVAASDLDEPRPRTGSRKAARRLFAASKPIGGTLAECYMRRRAITAIRAERWLRYHHRCRYRPCDDDPPGTPVAFPALIAAVTDTDGTITGVHRTWLDATTSDKAGVTTPRRAMGDLLGHGVRFGSAGAIMAAGEGIETMLSLRMAMPNMPMIAALSAAHLAALIWPSPLRRLYVVRDADPAGDRAWIKLHDRAGAAGIEIMPLVPSIGSDFNDALLALGQDDLMATLAPQLAGEDVDRFLTASA